MTLFIGSLLSLKSRGFFLACIINFLFDIITNNCSIREYAKSRKRSEREKQNERSSGIACGESAERKSESREETIDRGREQAIKRERGKESRHEFSTNKKRIIKKERPKIAANEKGSRTKEIN